MVDGDVLDFAGGARVIAAPGHTPGSDVILGAFNVDREQARDSLRRIAATGAQVAGFGHGEAVLSDAHVRIRTATDPLGT